MEKLGVSDFESLYGELRGLSNADVTKLKRATNTEVNVDAEAKNVFIAWISNNGADTPGTPCTRQAVLAALGKSKLNLAKGNLIEKKGWKAGIQFIVLRQKLLHF